MIEFTEAVLLELTAQDFMSTQEYAGIKHDEYGVAISSALQKRFDIEGLETWYVKFTVDLDDDGSQVLVVSLHEPAHKLKRVGGVLPIRFARSQS